MTLYQGHTTIALVIKIIFTNTSIVQLLSLELHDMKEEKRKKELQHKKWTARLKHQESGQENGRFKMKI